MIFVCELVVRLRRAGWKLRQFARSGWNVFNTIVIVLSLLPVMGGDIALLRVARMARIVHALRQVSHLRLMRFIPKFNSE